MTSSRFAELLYLLPVLLVAVMFLGRARHERRRRTSDSVTRFYQSLRVALEDRRTAASVIEALYALSWIVEHPELTWRAAWIVIDAHAVADPDKLLPPHSARALQDGLLAIASMNALAGLCVAYRSRVNAGRGKDAYLAALSERLADRHESIRHRIL